MLTKREKQVLELVAMGCTIQEIAGKLFISDTTVISHKVNIQGKLGARNSCQMVCIGMRMGFI